MKNLTNETEMLTITTEDLGYLIGQAIYTSLRTETPIDEAYQTALTVLIGDLAVTQTMTTESLQNLIGRVVFLELNGTIDYDDAIKSASYYVKYRTMLCDKFKDTLEKFNYRKNNVAKREIIFV